MISIPRSVLSTFRSLLRKAGLHKRTAGYSPGVTLVADRNGCLVRCASTQAAIQFHHPGSFVACVHRLPLEATTYITCVHYRRACGPTKRAGSPGRCY